LLPIKDNFSAVTLWRHSKSQCLRDRWTSIPDAIKRVENSPCSATLWAKSPPPCGKSSGSTRSRWRF